MKPQVWVSCSHFLFPLSLSSSTPFLSTTHYLQVWCCQVEWDDQGGWKEIEETKYQNFSEVHYKSLPNSTKPNPKQYKSCTMMTSFVAFDWKQITLQLLWEVASGSPTFVEGRGRGTYVKMLTVAQVVGMGIRLYMKSNLCFSPFKFYSYIIRNIIKFEHHLIHILNQK